MKYVHRFILAGLLTAVLLLIGACSQETLIDNDPGGVGSGDDAVRVKLGLTIPGASAGTRALTSDQEAKIYSVEVLTFNKFNKLSDCQTATPDDNTWASFSAMLKTSANDGDLYRLMIVANATDVIAPLLHGTAGDLNGHYGKSYAEICELLQHGVQRSSATWASKGLVMWGELESSVVINSSNNNYGPITLVRALARIDVGVNPTPSYVNGVAEWEKLDNFSLEEVYVYNANDTYTFSPARDTYSFSGKKVSKPTVPSGGGLFSPHLYFGKSLVACDETQTAKGVSLTGEVFVGEADILMSANGKYADANHENRMAIVVGGYYTAPGEPENSATLSYYRLDFTPGGGSTSLHDILRNHNYQVVIKKVAGPGLDHPDKAFQSFSTDMEADVKSWDSENFHNTVIDGHYKLSIDPIDITLSKWAKEETWVTVTTNHPDGWTAEVTDGGGWLTLNNATDDKVTGNASDLNTFSFKVIENSSSSSRTGKIKVSSGRMSNVIHVTQSDQDQAFMIRLSESELVFPGRLVGGGLIPSQSVEVEWGPTLHDYLLELTAYSGNGVKGYTPPASGNEARLEITLDEMTDEEIEADIFFERSSRLNVTVKSLDESETKYKQIMIRQINYALVVEGTHDYYMIGDTYTFTLRASTNWVAEVVDNQGILENITGATGYGKTDANGEKLSFRVKKNSANIGKTATITFRNPDGKFAPQTYVITAENVLPNSFMVTPGDAVSISVKKAYRVWSNDRDLKAEGIPSGGVLKAKLLWQDKESLITLVGSVMGSGEDASFFVQTTAGISGNAVVAFTIDDVIYWSWHLWVTDYNPSVDYVANKGYTLMDRHIGAFGDKRVFTDAEETVLDNEETYKTYGLFYQIGRKDPYPGRASYTNSLWKQLYDANNTPLTRNVDGIMVSIPAPPTENLVDPIKNPMIFYRGTYGNTSWYGQLVDLRSDLYGYLNKSEFDPCPEGWRVPIVECYRTTMVSGPYALINYGFDTEIGFFPAQEYLGISNGLPVLNRSSVISTNSGEQGMGIMSMAAGTFVIGSATTSARPAQGFNVRCMKDE